MFNLKEVPIVANSFVKSPLDMSNPETANDVCQLINEDKVTPEMFLFYGFLLDAETNFTIYSERILKFYSLFADRITNLNFLGLLETSGLNEERRFPTNKCLGLSERIYPLLARLPWGWGNSFTEISKIVTSLPNLKKLQLAHCDDPGNAYEQLNELPQLEELIIKGHHSLSYKSLSGLTQLKILDISQGVLHSKLSNLTNLQSLSVQQCSLDSSFSFSRMLQLTKLQINQCKTATGQTFCIKNLTNLKELEFDSDLFAKDENNFIVSLNITRLATKVEYCYGKAIIKSKQVSKVIKPIVKWSNFPNLTEIAYIDDFQAPMKIKVVEGEIYSN